MIMPIFGGTERKRFLDVSEICFNVFTHFRKPTHLPSAGIRDRGNIHYDQRQTKKKKIIAVRQNTEDMSAAATANESSFPVRVCLSKGFFVFF